MAMEINNETDYAADEENLVNLGRFVLDRLFVSPEAEISVILVDAESMARLHVEWMDLAGPTDVMSFPMDELRPGTAARPAPAGMLGDIVLCPEVAEEQAAAAGHPPQEELLLLTVHGILHLLGFDHGEPAEEAEMFGMQRSLLADFLGHEPPQETTR